MRKTKMLMVIFSWTIMGGAAFLFGKAITDSFYKERLEVMGRPDIYLVTGLIFLNVYSQCFSLFYKVAGIACTVLGMAGVMILAVSVCRWIVRKEKPRLFPGIAETGTEPWRPVLFCLCFLSVLFFCLMEPAQYDTGLYHSQAIRWIEEYAVVPGLGNLHMRLAYNSAFMCLQALFSLEWLVGQSLHTLNGFFCLAALAYVCFTLRIRGKESCQISDLLKCMMLLFVVQRRYDISSSGTDIEAMLLILYLLVKWAEYREKGEKDGVLYGWLCLVSVYAVTVKLSAAPVVLLALYPLYLFVKEKNGRAVFAHTAAGMVILAPWLIRNVILSGYLVYPWAGLDLFHMDWKMDAAVLAEDSLDIKMFARGLRNQAEYDDSLFGWIPKWFLSQSMGDRIVLLAGALCIPLLLYLLVRTFRDGEYALTALQAVSLVNVIFWLFSAPHMRYGGPYIYVLMAVTLGSFAKAGSGGEESLAGRRGRKAGGILLQLAAAAVTVWCFGLLAWVFTEIPQMESYTLVRQPNYLTWQSTQYPLGNVHIWMPDEGDLTGYLVFPATPQGRQFRVLTLRGETFQEGFSHE